MLILSAIILLSVLLLSINITGAWFTSGEGLKVQCNIYIGQFNLNVYQVKSTGETKLTNLNDSDESSPSFVDLTNETGSREIKPDTIYSLTLRLKNEDQGASSYYLRYKINLLVCGKTDSAINATFSGMNSGFVLAEDGYYYYGSSTTNLNQFSKGTTADLCTQFVIDYDEFYNNNYNGGTVKIEITIECSNTTTFA